MREVMKFLRSPYGGGLLVALIAGLGLYFLSNHRKRDIASQKVEDRKSLSVNESKFGITNPEKRPKAPQEQAKIKVIRDDNFSKFIPKRFKKAPQADQIKEKIIYREAPNKKAKKRENLVLPTMVKKRFKRDMEGERPQRVAPKVFAPRGMLLKAETILTIDSGAEDTPVMAFLTEDVYWNQKLIIPAGTLIHANSGGRVRDRIQVSGTFTFVWPNGKEYKIAGIALDHQWTKEKGFSITDGSAGIKGVILKTDEYQDLKYILAKAIEGAARSSKETFVNRFGNLEEETSARNSALEGVGEGVEAYANTIAKKMMVDGEFVRVAAGTQFYIYTKQVLEPNLRSFAGIKQNNKAMSSNELREEQYMSEVRLFEEKKRKEFQKQQLLGFRELKKDEKSVDDWKEMQDFLERNNWNAEDNEKLKSNLDSIYHSPFK